MAVQSRDANLLKIRRIARIMRGVMVVSLAVLAAADVAVWMVPEWVEAAVVPHLGIPPGTRIDLEPDVRFAGFVLSWLPLGLLGYAMVRSCSLFAEYAEGRLFSLQAARSLHVAARAIIALAIVSPLMQTGYVMLFTLSNGPGKRLLYLGFSSNDLLTAIVGGLLLAIALVMREAAQVAEENEQFV